MAVGVDEAEEEDLIEEEEDKEEDMDLQEEDMELQEEEVEIVVTRETSKDSSACAWWWVLTESSVR